MTPETFISSYRTAILGSKHGYGRLSSCRGRPRWGRQVILLARSALIDNREVVGTAHGIAELIRRPEEGEALFCLRGDSAENIIHRLERPANFRAREHWLLFWAAVISNHELLWSISARGSQEPTHNGAIVALLAMAVRTLGQLELVRPRSRGEARSAELGLDVRDLAIKDYEKKSGADFLVVVPLDEGDVKIALFQAKRSDGKHRISVSQRTSKHGPYQIDVLTESEKALYRLAHRPLPTTGEAAYPCPRNAAAYYVAWDRFNDKEPMAAPTCLSVRAACEAITKKTSKTMKYHAKVDPYGAHCADFAGLITLGLADPKCNVGVRIPSSDLPRVIAELTGVGSKTTPSKGAARHVGYPEGDDQGQTAPPPTIIGLGRGKARLQLAQVMDALTQDRDARQVVRLDDEAIARGIPDQPDD